MKAELNIYQKRAEGITYLSKQMLNYRDRTHLLQANLYRRAKQVSGQYNRKSQRCSSLHGQQAYDLLVQKYGMIDVLKYGL
jgi:hypothetical protein